MLNILTRPPKMFFRGALKYYAAGFATNFGRVRGPASVLASLKKGLSELDYPHKINQHANSNQTVHVVSNIEALSYAINAKKAGKIKRLIAGPNLVVLPTDHKRIIDSPEIDAYLVPSVWVRDMYVRLSPTLTNKIHIWPAGVTLPEQYREISTNPQKCLVMRKQCPDNVYQQVLNSLSKKNIEVKELHYGNFSQKKYFSALKRADFMVYLQEVESQGLALQEAWARNIPTLVWNKGKFTYPEGITVKGNIAAPFLTEEAGMLFSNGLDFEIKLRHFLNKFSSYQPRKYCERELSDIASATKYVKILSKIYPS